MLKRATLFLLCSTLTIPSCTKKVKNEIADQDNVITASHDKSHDAGEFEKYVSTLEPLHLPISLDSLSDYQKHSVNHDKDLFLKYKHKWALSPYGVLFRQGDITAILYITVGDALVPIIALHDKQGNIKSFLTPYKKSGEDIGYYSKEFAWMTDDRRVIVVDSTVTYELNESKDDILPETRKLSVDTVTYLLGDDGQISDEH